MPITACTYPGEGLLSSASKEGVGNGCRKQSLQRRPPVAYTLAMRTARKLIAGLVTLLLLALPAAACVAASEVMSQSEQECCREMAGDCGKVPMEVSHSCCTTGVSREQPAKGSTEFSLAPSASLAAELVSHLTVSTSAHLFSSPDLTTESPPPAFSPILRI